MTEKITGETEDHFWPKSRGILLLPHRQMSLQMLLLLVFLTHEMESEMTGGLLCYSTHSQLKNTQKI